MSQSAEEVAVVIADVIESRLPDVYTRKGAHDRDRGVLRDRSARIRVTTARPRVSGSSRFSRAR